MHNNSTADYIVFNIPGGIFTSSCSVKYMPLHTVSKQKVSSYYNSTKKSQAYSMSTRIET